MESRMALLPCDHRFHMKCVRGWLFRGGLTCPLCNLQLGGDGKLSDPHTAVDDPLPTRAVVVPEDAFVDGSVTGTLLGAPSPGLSSQSVTEEPEGRNLRESVSTTTKSPPNGASSVAARDFE